MNEKHRGPIKHYVINLDNATKRLDYMSKQFKKLNLSFERVPGADAIRLTAEELACYQPRLWSYRLLRDTEIACFLSHRRCWQFIADGEEDMATVFEDDALLSYLFVDFLKLRPWPKDIQLLSLEKTRRPLRARLVHEESGFQTYRVFNCNICCGGYLLTKAHAKFLLEQTQYFYCPVDDFLFHPRHLMSQVPDFRTRSYQVNPALCVQTIYNADMRAHYESLSSQQTKCQYFSKQVYNSQKVTIPFIKRMKRVGFYTAYKIRYIGPYVKIDYIK